MPRRSILSNAEKENLLALPDSREELIKHYTFSECDLSIIKQHRGAANRIGFAVQLCYMRYPGIILGVDETPFSPLLNLVADQLKIPPSDWQEYGKREQTRREHLTELHSIFGFQTFTTAHYQPALNSLDEIAWQTDKGMLLASALVQSLRTQLILLPSIHVIERICAEAMTKASRQVYLALTAPLWGRLRIRKITYVKPMALVAMV